MVSISRIELPLPGLEQMRAEALAEGYRFIEKLAREWDSGKNRFQEPGETLLGHLHEGLLVAVGGLNRDPYAGNPTIARLRRVYVRPAWRNQGIGRALVTTLIEDARKNFACVCLRAVNADAVRLYERLGFVSIVSPDATHILSFDSANIAR